MNVHFQSRKAGEPARPVGFGQSAANSTSTPNSTSTQWAALGDAANVVAMLAGIEPEQSSPEIRNFSVLLRDAHPWQREQAEHGIADLLAVMQPGISALLAINARGADPVPAANALWREFTGARSALLQLLPPSGAMGPRRSA